MHDAVPKLVAMAVRMVITTCTTVFHVSLFIVLPFLFSLLHFFIITFFHSLTSHLSPSHFLTFKGAPRRGNSDDSLSVVRTRGVGATRAATVARRRSLGIVGEVLGQLSHIASLGQLASSELSSGTGAHVNAVNVLRGRELCRSGRSQLLSPDACREDGQIVKLHSFALQHQLSDAAYHIGQHALDGSLRVRRIVLRHVLGHSVDVDGRWVN